VAVRHFSAVADRSSARAVTARQEGQHLPRRRPL